MAILVAGQSLKGTEASAGDRGLAAASPATPPLWCTVSVPPAPHTRSAQHKLAPNVPGVRAPPSPSPLMWTVWTGIIAPAPTRDFIALRPRGGAGSLSSNKKVGCKRLAKKSHMQTKAGGEIRITGTKVRRREKRRALTANLKRRFSPPKQIRHVFKNLLKQVEAS